MAGFNPEWIWGDDAETTVFAQAYGCDRTLIFSFTLDRSRPPTSLANRICTSNHDLESSDESHSFSDDAVSQVWERCVEDERAQDPSVVFALDSGADSSTVAWSAHRHPLFSRYLEYLTDESLGTTRIPPSVKTVDFSTLIRFEQLGGRGCATKVRCVSEPSDRFFVFKGIDFRTFLTYSDEDGDKTIRFMIQGWHNAESILWEMPRHQNVLPPHQIVVTLRHEDASKADVVCGTLRRLYSNGDVGSRIEVSNALKKRLTLSLKVRWCANMAAAVAHTHRNAHTYHMDIKPGNFLINFDEVLLLGDWEQTDSPATTLAPEADGTWDVQRDDEGVEAINLGGRPRPRYTKYVGPPRRNVEEDVLGDHSWDVWNVFPVWQAELPLATELAEVFSLGRTIWMLLRQPDLDFDEVEHPDDLETDWDGAEDIPMEWKLMTDRCLERDPNARPDVSEVSGFWNAQRLNFPE